jgi:hypothetical protein
MAEHDRQREQAADAQGYSEAIDTAGGPGPQLDQDTPAPMPIFNEHERAGREVHGAIDPADFAELGDRTGDELDHIRPIGEDDKRTAC